MLPFATVSDVNTTTVKQIMASLKDKFGVDLAKKKDLVKKLAMDFATKAKESEPAAEKAEAEEEDKGKKVCAVGGTDAGRHLAPALVLCEGNLCTACFAIGGTMVAGCSAPHREHLASGGCFVAQRR